MLTRLHLYQQPGFCNIFIDSKEANGGLNLPNFPLKQQYLIKMRLTWNPESQMHCALFFPIWSVLWYINWILIFFSHLINSLAAASPQQSAAILMWTRQFGLLQEAFRERLPTARCGTMINRNSAIPVTLARLVCWPTLGGVGGRSLWSTSLYWSS